ncbi:MAG: hypothetical protein HDR50_06635 [Desulfovibrio sp.]|uniref:hypothetical protein n=1 Tax=Desulfovibrio sp. TaxID=885 RepID=UPI001A7B502F|nr:hypothetical protein [Desulfovibrio sp.]MBD5417325.1 hypothetical protein [Desulfovibrio sp.]
MPYVFCLLVDIASIACTAWIGWLVYCGATKWLILIMAFLALSVTIPGRDIFKCPNCGWVDEIKVYKNFGTIGVQKDKNDPDD